MDTSNDHTWSSFADLLATSSRVLCVVGAGLSASSGLTTWRGTNGLWNDINLKELASPKKFHEDPVTVWSFYGERLLQTLEAQPNAAHHALAALARWHEGWLTINQNVDGIDKSLRDTNHTSGALILFQGFSNKPIIQCQRYWAFTVH
jgi:NAD-dependent SIR2 family protein deacetylase